MNKYNVWYDALIAKAAKRGTGNESHHIVPRCLGGTDEKTNLVMLTYREHYLAHLLLAKGATGRDAYKLWYAWHRMVFNCKYPNSRKFELFRRSFVEALKESHPAKRNQESWSDTTRKNALRNWAGNTKRKSEVSALRKKMWENPEYRESQSRRLKEMAASGGTAAALAFGKKIEYNGVTYNTWGDFVRATGVSKHLYNKYYVNGIDPTPRIGADGPLRK